MKLIKSSCGGRRGCSIKTSKLPMFLLKTKKKKAA